MTLNHKKYLRNPLQRFVSEWQHVQRGATWKSLGSLMVGSKTLFSWKIKKHSLINPIPNNFIISFLT